MSKVSFEDIGMVTATFTAREDVKSGQVVKITGNGEVGACADGDAFCGLALSVRSGFAGVQVKGFACVPTLWHGDAGSGEAGRRRGRRCEARLRRRHRGPGGQRGQQRSHRRGLPVS